MALRLTFDFKTHNVKMETMQQMHEALTGSPAYKSSEIAILEPNGRNSNNFMLDIGNDNDSDYDILFEAGEMEDWDGEVDALDPSIRFERFDSITMLALNKTLYKSGLLLNNTASGVYITPNQIDMVLTVYDTSLNQHMIESIQNEFGNPIDFHDASDGFFNVPSAAIKFFNVVGFRRPKCGIMEPCTRLIASIGLWEGEETWASLYQKKYDLWIQFMTRLGAVGLSAPVTDMVRSSLEQLR